MIHAKVIAMAHPTALPEHTPPCNHYQHSKFVRRRQYVDETLIPQIKRLGFDTEMFPAVTDADFHIEGKEVCYQDLRFTIEYGSAGCYLSHVMLWRYCVAANVTLFVLEDDAKLPAAHEQTIVDAVKRYDQLSDTGDLLYLQGQLPYHPTGIHEYPPHILNMVPGTSLKRVWPINDMAGTAAYAVKPKAAAKLLARTNGRPIHAVDGFIHGTVNAGEIGVLVPMDHAHVFMLDDHYAEWNHVHHPVAEGAA